MGNKPPGFLKTWRFGIMKKITLRKDRNDVMKKIKILMLVLICSSSLLFGQVSYNKKFPLILKSVNNDSCKLDSVTNKTIERPDTNIRANYIYMTLGIIEPIALGFGFQINSDWSLGIKLCGYFLSYGTYALNSGLGIGIRISKKIKWGFINNINSELTMLNRISDSRSSEIFIKGAALDINIGNENISSKTLHFIWSVGVVGSFANRIPPLFSPSLKIGFNINI